MPFYRVHDTSTDLPPSRTAAEERTQANARVSYELQVQRFLQPDDVTCGPTCLRKVYDFYGLTLPVEQVLAEIDRNEDGGTLAVYLGISALRRGFGARLYSYDLRILDPTWQRLDRTVLASRIRKRIRYLSHPKAKRSANAYLDFLSLGGEFAFEELNPTLIKTIINRDHPVLAGLSATYLYGMPRERHDPDTHALVDDDVAGDPVGHFVVISGYAQWGRQFTVRDPSAHVPASEDGRIIVDSHRLINSILLGDLTYDAVLLELWPDSGEESRGF